MSDLVKDFLFGVSVVAVGVVIGEAIFNYGAIYLLINYGFK